MGAAAGPLRRSGREKNLELGVGENGGADVAALGHQPPLKPHGLLLGSEGLAHTAVGSHQGDLGRYLRAANRLGHVEAIDAHKLLAGAAGTELQIQAQQQGFHSRRIGRVGFLAQHPPGEGPVHGAGVQVNQAHLARKGTGDGALARPRWSINGNDRQTRHQKTMVDQAA